MGSPREVLLILLWLQREQMEHAQTRAIIQTIANREKASEAFEDYKKARFPWIESSQARDKVNHIKQLMEEVKKGPIQITAQHAPSKMRSRLKTKVIERTDAAKAKIAAEQKKIYEKVGSIVQ